MGNLFGGCSKAAMGILRKTQDNNAAFFHAGAAGNPHVPKNTLTDIFFVGNHERSSEDMSVS